MCPHDLTARGRQPHRLQVCLPRVAASSSLAVHTIIARIQPAHRAHCCLSRCCTIRRLSPTLRTLAAGGLFHWYWQRTLGRVGQVRLQTCAEAGPRKLAVVRLRHGRVLGQQHNQQHIPQHPLEQPTAEEAEWHIDRTGVHLKIRSG